MKKKVVLCIAQEEWDEHEDKGVCPPPGLGYIGSLLLQEGYDVKIIDGQLHNYNAQELTDQIEKENADFVGFTATTYNRFKAIEAIKEVKKRLNVPILVGGCHFSPTAEDCLKNVPEIDYVIVNEGEFTTLELLNKLSNNEPINEVRGLVYREGNQIVRTSLRDWIKDLSKEIPPTNWELFELDKYKHTLEVVGTTGKSIGIMTSRGCPQNCVFCSSPKFWKRKVRFRYPIEIVDELELLHKKYGYSYFDFYDDTLTVNPNHVKEICNEIINRGLDIKWYGRARVDTVNKEILELMKKSGCIAISYGVESGSQKILNSIHKNITPEKVYETIKISADLGFHVKAFFLFSLPDERKKDINQTLELMDKLKAISPKIGTPSNFTLIFPGTELEVIAKREGTLAEDFSWNTKPKFEERRVRSENLTMIPFEQKAFTAEDIRAHIINKMNSNKKLFKIGLKKIKSIKSFKDFKKLLKDTKNIILNKIK